MQNIEDAIVYEIWKWSKHSIMCSINKPTMSLRFQDQKRSQNRSRDVKRCNKLQLFVNLLFESSKLSLIYCDFDLNDNFEFSFTNLSMFEWLFGAISFVAKRKWNLAKLHESSWFLADWKVKRHSRFFSFRHFFKSDAFVRC